MTTPPYTPSNNHISKQQATTLDSPGTSPTPTPLISHRDGDFSLADIQHLTKTFDLIDIEHADAESQTLVWVAERPGTDTPTHTLHDLEDRKITIYRGAFIRAAFQIPDGTQRVIWEHRVFDDNEPTLLDPGTALVEAQAANWTPIKPPQPNHTTENP